MECKSKCINLINFWAFQLIFHWSAVRLNWQPERKTKHLKHIWNEQAKKWRRRYEIQRRNGTTSFFAQVKWKWKWNWASFIFETDRNLQLPWKWSVRRRGGGEQHVMQRVQRYRKNAVGRASRPPIRYYAMRCKAMWRDLCAAGKEIRFSW